MPLASDISGDADLRRFAGKLLADVFVSYKSEDRALAAMMVSALESSGLTVWWDQHIGMGEIWRAEITEHLDGAKAVVVLWTGRSAGREGRFVQEEAQRALQRGTYRPVLLDNVLLPLGFSEIQAHRLIEWSGDRHTPEFLSLLDAIRAMIAGRADAPAASTPEMTGAARRGASERRTITLLRAAFVHDNFDEDDPEVLDEVMLRIESRLGDLTRSDRVTLLQLDPDGFSVAVGASGAQEDDEALSAALALTLRDGLLEDPAVETKIALTSGLAVVTLSPMLRVSGSLLGRGGDLLQHARPGEIVVDSAMARRIDGSFVLHETGDGHDGAWAIEGRSGPGERARIGNDALSLPLVGRTVEMQRLNQALQLTMDGRGRAFCVIGEPGMGKSRLLHEFLERARQEGAIIGRANCRSHDRTSAYGPFADIVWSLFDLARLPPEDRPRLARERICEQVPEVAEYAPCLLHLAGLADGDEAVAGRALIGEAIQTTLVALAERQAVVLLIDDLQLADEATLEILLATAEVCASFRILLLAGTRSAGALAWPAMPHCEQIVLDSLSPDEVGELVRHAADADTVDPELAALLHRRTDGIPLFAEELVRVLLTDRQIIVEDRHLSAPGPIDRVRLPHSIDAMVRTRLDNLEPRLRNAIRTAAVIGRQFGWWLLRDLLDVSGPPGLLLGPAVSQGLLQQVRIAPEPEYRFRQVLTQEVAYDSLLSKERRALHLRAGIWIEANRADHLHEAVEELAHHFLLAEDTEKAIHYHFAAGKKALGWGSVRAAAEMFATAVQLIETLDPDDAQRQQLIEALVLEGNARMLLDGYHSQRMGALLRRVEDLVEALPPGDVRFGAAWWLWRVAYNCSSMTEAQRRTAELHEVARATGDSVHRLAACTAEGIVTYFMGEVNRAREKFDAAARLIDPETPLREGPLAEIAPEIWLTCFRGMMQVFAGEIEQGIEEMRRAERLARELAHPHLEAFVQIYFQSAAIPLGDLAMWRAANERAAELSRKHELGHWGISNLMLSGLLKLVEGDIPAGTAALKRGEAMASLVGIGMLQGLAIGLALTKAASGDVAGAIADLDALNAQMERDSMYYQRGEVAMHLMHLDAANAEQRMAAAERALGLAIAGGHRLAALRLGAAIAAVHARQGRPEQAVASLRTLLEPFDATAQVKWPSIAAAAAQLKALEAATVQEA